MSDALVPCGHSEGPEALMDGGTADNPVALS